MLSSSSSILSLSQSLSRACWCESYCLTQRWRHSLLSPLHSLLSKAVALITGSRMTGARTRVEERCRCWGHQDVGHLTTCKPFLPPSPYWYQLRGAARHAAIHYPVPPGTTGLCEESRTARIIKIQINMNRTS